MGGLEIGPLRPGDEARQVAAWIFQEWARFEPGMDWPKCLAGVEESLRPGLAIPHFLVCRLAGTAVGCSSIVVSDLPIRPDLGPWLANVFVLPSHRRQGIGLALVRAAMDYAKPLAATLYLYTHDQQRTYLGLGWETMGLDKYAGRDITVMRHRS